MLGIAFAGGDAVADDPGTRKPLAIILEPARWVRGGGYACAGALQ